MCLEDIRIMRKTKVITNRLAIVLADPPILAVPYNSKRVSLILGSKDSNGIRFGIKPDPLFMFWWSLPNAPFILNLMQHGALVFGPWYADGAVAADTLIVTECFLEEE